ncbi:hypothetical protein CEUSTIGMA_g3787.t1 [Chlamydomonas eustigma]|uniref:Phosphoglycerate mutase (2,3-diphosphoglycerate-dependent) n=1 Tax=Chlamydomonas eustigma TaxID=1157962 RepID=A0A250WZT4_9CHLO|nr:hypothetical protein CEUSTIGMA_g3787.t1 [Chlamydomonas eustigma]|eukprot:GAX76341.1 hypothetical protein CEUSTIGMA_g3787.t1 [Chlamydomonas eustigma]
MNVGVSESSDERGWNDHIEATPDSLMPCTLTTRSERRTLQDAQRNQKDLGKFSTDVTVLYLVRHGETDWNVSHRLQGQDLNAPGLSVGGRKQARQLAQRLTSMSNTIQPQNQHPVLHLDAVYCSDLIRAVETADIIVSHLRECRSQHLQVSQCPELRERNLGVLQGLTVQEAAFQQPIALAAMLSRKSTTLSPKEELVHHSTAERREGTALEGGVESVEEMMRRARAKLDSIASQHPGGQVLVVTHGGVLHALYHNIMGRRFSEEVKNTSLSSIMLERGHAVVLTWNSIDHLTMASADSPDCTAVTAGPECVATIGTGGGFSQGG